MHSNFSRVGVQGLGVCLGLVLAAPASAATLGWVSPGSVATTSLSGTASGFLLPGDALRLSFDWIGTEVAGDGSVMPADGRQAFGDGSVRFVFETPIGSFGPGPDTTLQVLGGELATVSNFNRFASIICDGSVRPGDAGLLPSFEIAGDGSVREVPGDGSVTPVPGAVRLGDGSVRICDGSVRPATVSFSFDGLGWSFLQLVDEVPPGLLASGAMSPRLIAGAPQPIPLPPALPMLAAGLLALAGLSRRRG
jgi:hypothetical protein